MMRTIEPRTKSQKTFVSDCEGPISKNDNAYELTAHFLPDGAHFFSLISRYDDVLADVAKKPGYKPGDTLRLILPFLKAYGATNAKMTEYSSKHILLVPGAAETLRLVNLIMPSFIVSTSYEQYIFSLCDLINFSHENVYCTKLDIDKYVIDPHEITRLRELREEISSFSMVEIPKDARSVSDLSQRDQETIGRLDEIFWSDL
jgi:energy-converting hydrogenase A subunit R